MICSWWPFFKFKILFLFYVESPSWPCLRMSRVARPFSKLLTFTFLLGIWKGSYNRQIDDYYQSSSLPMAAVETRWRNAACLMFLTGPFRFSKAPQKISNPLVVSKSPFIRNKCEQRSEPSILFAKRHSKAGFMVYISLIIASLIIPC